MVYYNAIRKATNSEVLRGICEQLLVDEVAHIRFQCQRLAILHRNRPRWLYWLTMAAHRFLFTGITLAVWFGHRRALRAGGYSFVRFWRRVWGKMRYAWRIMSPRAYFWPNELRNRTRLTSGIENANPESWHPESDNRIL
ncbi:MAG: hypothetical protein ACFCD0_08740 [Gemmataceae bacterium]